MRRSNQYRLKANEIEIIERLRTKPTRNVLVIGDLHEPFCLDKYLDFCIAKYTEFNCNQVIFIGDVIDNHYTSYHETHGGNDLMTGADELELAIKRIGRWYKAFNKKGTKVIIGNHDRMIMRKAHTSAIPEKWIKSYKEVLQVPNWEFVPRYEQDGVQYLHGEGGQAFNKCRSDLMNTVQGHLHTLSGCQHYVGRKFRVYGVQVGCGIDFKKYSFAYARAYKKPAIGCAVILNNGQLPINLLMPLGKAKC
jgi:metallophosphoesterase superfamily enzyme